MTSVAGYVLLIAATGLERLAELRIARRNASWSFARGGKELGGAHFPIMVALHLGLLLAAPAEVILLDRPFLPTLGIAMLVVAVGSQGLRWWCIRTLGPQWNTRVIVVAGLPRVVTGPYRWLNHPNYVAVVLEGIALPLVHTAWITALVFTILNAWLLSVRVRVEALALRSLPDPEAST